MSVVEALAREVGSVGVLLRKLKPADWERPTRCPPMTVKEIAAHAMRGALRIEEMLDKGPLDAEPEKDASTYFQYDPVAEGPEILARAQQEAATRTPEQLVREWDERWSRALRRSREELGTDSVFPGAFGSIRLSEYCKTRCVEVLVHHMDIDDALGIDPHPDAETLTIVGDVLRDLLGTDLRPVGMEDVRFVLVGTGRAALDEPEREYLGPLVERFPLLA